MASGINWTAQHIEWNFNHSLLYLSGLTLAARALANPVPTTCSRVDSPFGPWPLDSRLPPFPLSPSENQRKPPGPWASTHLVVQCYILRGGQAGALPYMAKVSLGLVASAGKCRAGSRVAVPWLRSRWMTDGRCATSVLCEGWAVLGHSGTSSKPRLSQLCGGVAAAQSMSAIKAWTRQGCKTQVTCAFRCVYPSSTLRCSQWLSSRLG